MNAVVATIENELDDIAPQIAALLPPDVSPDKFRQVALAAIRQKPELLRLDRQSLFNACLNAAQDGLLPDGREGAIVPRKGKAVWQPMVQGIYKRVKTSGSVASLSANVVYEGEPFRVALGDEDRIVHERDMSKVRDGSEVAVYAIATLKDGTKEREVMTWEQVMVVRQSSATPNDGAWVTQPGEMARKTVVRRLAKRLPVLDPADETLHRAIGRVDSLYNFGAPQSEAPPPSDARTAINAGVPIKAAASEMQRSPRITEPAPKPAPPRNGTKPRGYKEILASLRLALQHATSREAVDRILSHDEVKLARETFKDDALDELNKLITDALAKWFHEPPTDEDDEVHIEGEENLAAGD